ncbi:MAG: FGGY-family carbohydrate kinase [Phyllobacterium sp.]
MASYFIGVDVGTGSARAGIFDLNGTMLSSAKRDIQLFREGSDIAEQSSEDIWQAVTHSVRTALSESGLKARDIGGIGYDATCSLVVVGTDGEPLPVGSSGLAERNIIVWMDHRAIDQTRRINDSRDRVLRYVGGTISPEMETPKLLWLKENMPEAYQKAWQFFDLADYLSWRSTGDLARSVCTVTCKWTYLAHEKKWDADYFRTIGLDDIAEQNFARIGTNIVDAGSPLGQGLTTKAAEDLGLLAGTPVAAGLIDAHAGGIGSVGGEGGVGHVASRMAYVFGTSACTMASSVEPVYIPGVWGPYYSAMVPGFWLSEGGQSSAGAAIDHVVSLHPAAAQADVEAAKAGCSVPEFLANQAVGSALDPSSVITLAGGLHVVPDFLGNRSPFADPHATGLIAGIRMERDLDSLVALYIACLSGLGYGLRQIIETSRKQGAAIDAVVLSGGAGRHELVRQMLADGAGLPVMVARENEPVLLGSAMLAAVAAGAFASLPAAMQAMSAIGSVYQPRQGEIARLHERRFHAFETLQSAACTLQTIT